jgi:beta-N-acetylhexosaminidase
MSLTPLNSPTLGPLMMDLHGLELLDSEQRILKNPNVGGLIFFSRNFESREQIQKLVQQVRNVAPNILIAVDQEGGRVQRFKDGFTRLPAMQCLGDYALQHPVDGLRLCKDVGWLMASEILSCGIDFSFAPVLDVDRDTCTVIGDRSFSENPQHMVVCAQAFIDGMHEAGMGATGKHFPGHGSVVADSHLETPYDNRTLDQLRVRDLIPFANLASTMDAVMPAHMVFPQITDESVGFSSFWLQDVLRTELGFNGVIFSDDLSMKGADVAGGYCAKAKAALSAGCDMVLVCNDPRGAQEVLQWLDNHSDDFAEISSGKSAARLQAMQRQKRPDWGELTLNRRYQGTRKKLHELEN